MTKTLLTTALVLAVSALPASAGNLVVNGSFEDKSAAADGLGGLYGWTIGGTDGPGQGSGYPPVAIYYGAALAYPDGAFGEAVPANNAPTNSPDPVGARAAYFVSDFAHSQSLWQEITVATSGTYQIGFSAYAPANGYRNANDARFSGKIAGVVLADYLVKGGLATTWQTFQGATHLDAGTHLIEFVFNTNGYPAADVVIDQVYVIEGNPPVPTPDAGSTAFLFATGLASLVGVTRRIRRRA